MGLFSQDNQPSRSDLVMLPKVDENLVAVGGDLSVSSLLAGYRQGRFPWTYHPITWWSPDPRTILELDAFHLSRSLKKSIKKYTVTLDLCFREVIEGCATPGPNRGSTWITPEFVQAYTNLHEAGYAHSFECWQEGKLVGGLYGVALGAYFVGESMFSRANDASKVILAHLIPHLRKHQFVLFDIQMPTRVTMQLGARLIPRAQFLQRLAEALSSEANLGPPGKLDYHPNGL